MTSPRFTSPNRRTSDVNNYDNNDIVEEAEAKLVDEAEKIQVRQMHDLRATPVLTQTVLFVVLHSDEQNQFYASDAFMCITNYALTITWKEATLILDVPYARDRSELWHVIHILDIHMPTPHDAVAVQQGQVTKILDSRTTVLILQVLPDLLKLQRHL